MPRTEVDTTKTTPLPLVLLVGASPGLVERCCDAAAAAAVGVKECDLARLATQAALWRPLVIILPRDLYDFDPSEFDALAKDVGARLVTLVSEDVTIEELEREMVHAVEEAERDRAP